MEANSDQQQAAQVGPPWRWKPLRRVLQHRCPQCGEGLLFRAFARMHERCSECGLVYRREPGASTGSMYISAAVTQVFAALLAFGMFLFTGLSTLHGCLLAVPLVLGFSYAFLPQAMGLWVAVEYCTDRANHESWIRKP